MVSLKDLLNDFGEEIVSEKLASFYCARNQDVEKFIKLNAIRFEKTHNARTYLIFDEENMTKGILGYISLSFKEVILQPETKENKSEVKRLNGISKNAEDVKVFLLGQLGKNDSVENDELDLSRILDLVYEVILSAQKLVGGRVLLLECQNIPKLIKAYEGCGFKILQTQKLVQMYRFVDNLIPKD